MVKLILSFLFWLLSLAIVFATEFDMNSFLRKKIKNKVKTIVLPTGTLHISNTVILNADFHDIKITGNGKTRLIMTKMRPIFFLTGCRNIIFDGFKVDYDPLPFTQGLITDIKDRQIFFKIDTGYPDLTPLYQVKHPLFFDGITSNWKWEASSNYATMIKANTPRLGVVTMGKLPLGLTPGDRICLNHRSTTVFKLRNQAADITFSNLTIESGPGGAFIARRTSGRHKFINVVIKRGPLPAGATVPRLISTSADGVNYGTSRKGPLLEKCNFSFMGDDSVNFHGVVLPVIKRGKDYFMTVMGYRPNDLGKVVLRGDKARILAPGNFQILKTVKVEQVEALSGIDAVSLETVSKYYKGQKYTAAGKPRYILYRIKLAGFVPEVGQYIDFPAVNCPDYIIEDSTFHDHRARGLRLMASGGKIDSCNFYNIGQSAISVGPEYGYWREGGWVSRVNISNNIIKNVCQGDISWSKYSYFAGAISIFARLDPGGKQAWPGNTEISIIGNKISNCPVSGIFIYAANGVTVNSNYISNVNQVKANETGRHYGINYKANAISINHSKKILTKDNVIK